jgi:2-methylcitrate dehydratase PrpD
MVGQIASWSSALDLDAVPDDVNQAAKRCIVDLVGVAIAGASRPQSRRTFRYARETYAPGPATAFGFEDRLSPVAAALVNGTVGHVLDFDDTSYSGIMHGSTVVLPAALAAAEFANADGRRLFEAYVVGVEVSYAIALLCTTSHYHKGWWSTATFGAFGAAAAAAKAMELSESQATNALALAGVQACGLKVAFGTDAKPFLAGRAAAIGVEAALLASSGYNAPPAVLEDRRGFIHLLNDGVVNYDGIDKLGKEWRLINPGIFFKQYPVCSAAHAAVELTQRLLEKHELQSKTVQKVICEVPPLVAISLVYDMPDGPQAAQFSMPFAVGTMLARGRLGIEDLTTEALTDPGIQMEMSKVEMRRVDSLQDANAPECARVTIVTDDGGELTEYLGEPTGMPGNPMSDDQLHNKFLRCTTVGGLHREQATALLQHLTSIESVPSGMMRFGFESAKT